MLKIELHNHGTNEDRCLHYQCEIEIAEQLRHRLEERLLAPSAPPPPLPASRATATGEASVRGKCYRQGHQQL